MKKIEFSSYIDKFHFRIVVEPENSFSYSEEKDMYCWSINIYFSVNENKIKNFYIPIEFTDTELDEINTKLLLNYITEKDYINILQEYLKKNSIREDIVNILESDFGYEEELGNVFKNISYNLCQDFIQFHIKPIPVNDMVLMKYLIHKEQEWKINYTLEYENLANKLLSRNIDIKLKENALRVNSQKILDEANNKISEFKENFLEYNCKFDLIQLDNISYEEFYHDLVDRYRDFKDFYEIFRCFKSIYDFSKRIKNFDKVF